MSALRPQSHNPRTRRGAVAFEALIVLPLFSLIVIGMVGLADLIISEQLLAEASARGARTAALGGTEDQIRDSILAVLGPQRGEHVSIHVFPVSALTNDEKPENSVYRQSDGRDNWKCRPGELIEVRIELECQYAAATRFCPVSPNELLIGRSVMQCE
jgi:hypothetical protein